MEEVLLEVKQLRYSEDGILDLINCVDRAIKLSANRSCSSKLNRIKRDEVRQLVKPDIENRRELFNSIRIGLESDIRLYCLNRNDP